MTARRAFSRVSWAFGVVMAVAIGLPADAQRMTHFSIAPQPLKSALIAFGLQSGRGVVGASNLTKSRTSPGFSGDTIDAAVALRQVLKGTGLTFLRDGADFIIVAAVAERPRPATNLNIPAAPKAVAVASSPTRVGEVVLTGRHEERSIENLPFAITALSGRTMEARKIEGGPDLLRAVPNVSFTKTNFSSYDLSIRGIGAEALSVEADPSVSVNFNGVTLIRNRLFEQEFFDIDSVEVLRGPQGTLYGRNATAGAVNINAARPTDIFQGELKAETGNYDTRRLSGFVNLPIDGKKLELRVSGSYTGRSGYEYNSMTGDRVDGRNLYSIRSTLSFNPIETLHGILVWEHFDENDNRVRSGKQLCTRDPGLTSIAGISLNGPIAQAALSQGCADASLYARAAFGTPNGLSNPIVVADSILQGLGAADGAYAPLLNGADPYGGLTQSPNLREIASKLDPRYRARSNIVQLNLDYDVTPTLRLSSQTVVDWDASYSNQDFDRFDSLPGAFNAISASSGLAGNDRLGGASNLTAGGVYCDPQLGCSSAIVGEDEDNAVSRQVTQEIHLTSSFAGPLNFSLGADYTSFRALENYYIFFNTMSALAQVGPVFGNDSNRGQYDVCHRDLEEFNVTPGSNSGCIYIDPGSLSNINGQGHNYYRSISAYKLGSESIFGELYYQPTDTVSVTAGVRYSNDIKTTTPYPTQTLLSGGFFGGGTVDGGYPALPDLKHDFPALTGRFVIAWSPTPAFTDKTLVYASYSRGAKSGGANPPGIGYSTTPLYPGGPALFAPTSYPAQYKPEKVDAFEIGTKNLLMGGRLAIDAAFFFYDYKNYQVSQVEQDNVVNENFNAEVWGAEWEARFQATRRFRLNAFIGYQRSSIERGQQSIDVDNRTQGVPGYVVLRPWLQLSDNCVVSKAYAASILNNTAADPGSQVLALIYNGCPGYVLGNYPNAATAPASIFPNEGRGFYADLSGHSLPNMPASTQSIGAQYDFDLPEGWRSNLRIDYYHQGNSWARVYQDPIDVIRGWSNINLRLALTPPRGRIEIEFYCKNLLDTAAITGTFLNSDDRYLSANVFTTAPRLIGASLSVRF